MSGNQREAPLAAAMKAYAAGGALAFHTPGHKQGLGAHPLLKELITETGLRQEVSLMAELDDLNCPAGCIREAQALAAELYGADDAWFMVNGTTGAIQTMMLAALEPGDEVLVPRNAHRSILGGLILTGAVPVYLPPVLDEQLGIAMGLTAETVAAGFAACPGAKAVLAVYPTYYGVTYDLMSVAAMAHAHGAMLLVDEAHGAHLPFSEELPTEALALGADMAALSTHKLLGSLTQTSMLLAKGLRVDRERVRRAAALLTSTSPNYLMLASLDIARLQMAEYGDALVGRAVRLAGGVRAAVNDTPGLWCFGPEYLGRPGAEALDATKLTVQTAWLGLTGAAAETVLRRDYGLQLELTDAYNVLFLLTMADTEREACALIKALKDFALRHRREPLARTRFVLPELPSMKLTPREAFFAPSEAVPFALAAGRTAAEEIGFYPPGVPVLCPGEGITTALLEHLQAMKEAGLRVSGPEDPALRTIRVVR